MPDTKIHKTPQGWIDDDDPNTFYPVRWQARAARRAKRNSLTPQGAQAKKFINSVMKSSTGTGTKSTTVSVLGMQNSVTKASLGTQPLTSLQDKLFTRLTTRQGVDPSDALNIITSNGYNKAASYGHMRAAGATHTEAEIVINLDNPDISLAYGKRRGVGDNHTDALSFALTCVN